jgi:hypothetical protein
MTTPRDFSVDLGSGLDMGTFTVPAAAGLTGSKARLRIGRKGAAALIELFSDDPPDAPATFSWTLATTQVRIDLTKEVLAGTGGAGSWYYWVHIVTSDDQPIDVDNAEGILTINSIALAAAS